MSNKLINVEELAKRLASLAIVKITAETTKISNEDAARKLFSKSENGKLEIISDLKEDYQGLIDHYKEIIMDHES